VIEGLFTPGDGGEKRETPTAPPGPAPAKTEAIDKPLTVSALAARINERLSASFPASVRVLGEISNFTNRTHWYFAVKDAGAVLNCVMFAGRAKGHRFVPANGQSVVVTAKVEVYEPQGKLTLIAEKIEPVGMGALDEAYQRLVAELRTLGWFAPERKRPLPVFPRRLAVVTSRKGAALADVLNTMARRCPGVEVCLIDCLVQGAAAAPDVTRAVGWVSANAVREGIDALLVTRGGGSMEDLWAFNDRAVAQAVLDCRVPVVAAIGHETDVTIVELVADARASTPTQAAMLLTPDRDALRQELLQNGRRLYLTVKRDLTSLQEGVEADRRRLVGGLRNRIGDAHTAIARLSTRLERCRPAALHARRGAAVEAIANRLHGALRSRLRDERHGVERSLDRVRASQRAVLYAASQRLASASRQLTLVGPVSVLQRGYSVTYKADGTVVRGPQDVKTGEAMVTRLAEGRIESVVGKSLAAPLPKARRKKSADDGSGGLFA
jgi:exodeoxyribonuclease VII large subunit